MATSLEQKATSLSSILAQHKDDILAEWLREMSATVRRSDLIKDSELQSQCSRFLDLLMEASTAAGTSFQSGAYDPMRDLLGDISRSRALQGFTARETASFVFSIKRPFFNAIRTELAPDPTAMAREMWNATDLLDRLGLYTIEIYLKSREETIRRQQEEMLELSTPVVKLWEGILALPLIGTLDAISA